MSKNNKLSPMKILEAAIKKEGSISALHKALIRHGINVSQSALSQAKNHSKQSIRMDILVGLVEIAFDGDWKKAGKFLKDEFGIN